MDTTASGEGERLLQRWLDEDEHLVAWLDARVVYGDSDGEHTKTFELGLTEGRLIAVDASDGAADRLDAAFPTSYLLNTWLEDFPGSTDLVIRLTTGAYVRFEVAGSDRQQAAEFCRQASLSADRWLDNDEAALGEVPCGEPAEPDPPSGLVVGPDDRNQRPNPDDGHPRPVPDDGPGARERVLVGAAAGATLPQPGSMTPDGYFMRVDKPKAQDEDVNLCRHCGRHVRDDAVFCGWCGTTV